MLAPDEDDDEADKLEELVHKASSGEVHLDDEDDKLTKIKKVVQTYLTPI